MGADDAALRDEMMRLLSDVDYRNGWYDWLVMCEHVSLSWIHGVGPVSEHIVVGPGRRDRLRALLTSVGD